METTLYNQSGETVGVIELSEYIFGIVPNVPVMHQAAVRQQANARLGTHNTRGRGEVAGSTRKLYRQKAPGVPGRAPSARRTARAVASRTGRTRVTTSACRRPTMFLVAASPNTV